MAIASHVIAADAAGTLDGLLRERVRLTPDQVACSDYSEEQGSWRDCTWAQMDREVARWQAALAADGLQAGDRVAVMLRNSPEWMAFDQAALGLGLVVVPLYTQDRPDNVAYILRDAGCKLLLMGSAEQWQEFAGALSTVRELIRIVSVSPVAEAADARLKVLADWLPEAGAQTRHVPRDPAALATIVYTSGTTGRPKGVMLSHRNILSNAEGACSVLLAGHDDIFLSFLPLSHTFERTCGYYLPMMTGSRVVYSRGVQQLADDLQAIRPTLLISVPRIYERVYARIRAALDEGSPVKRRLFDLAVEVGYARFEHSQGRGPWRASFLLWPVLDALVAKKILARLGGNMRAAISGGAALPPAVSRVFIGLGLTVLQGYGMTETSPIACANRPHDNVPASVGCAIPDVELKLGESGALMIRGPNVMLGYWNNPEATNAILAADGWLNSGDTARIDEQGHVYITGRLKEIIVLSNGEKVPPVDMETAIMHDSVFEHVMLLGEGKPYLSAVAVLHAQNWHRVAEAAGLQGEPVDSKAVEDLLLARIAAQLREFPGYAQVRRVSATVEPWTVENGMLTPTLKLKRARVMERFNAEIDRMYEGH